MSIPRPAVVSRVSKIDGQGVFVETPFLIGQTLLEIDDSRIVNELHPLGPGDDPRHCDYLARVTVVLMQPPERYINHCCRPNSYVKTVNGRRRVIALRNIATGEEITYDYCINSGGDIIWTCHCGAQRCRHVIHSDFFHLPIGLQREYLPLLDNWFREERAADVQRLHNLIEHHVLG